MRRQRKPAARCTPLHLPAYTIHPEHSVLKDHLMNTIIYIVGLVVIIGAILSYFGFR